MPSVAAKKVLGAFKPHTDFLVVVHEEHIHDPSA